METLKDFLHLLKTSLDLLNVTVGLIIGLITGFYFERRTTKTALAQNKELQRELESVRHSVYSMGGNIPKTEANDVNEELIDLVRKRALAIQGPEGKLVKGVLVSYFVGRGYKTSEIVEVIERLCSTGAARCNGKWLEMS